MPVGIPLVNQNNHFPENREVSKFMISKVGGNAKDLLKPVFLAPKPQKCQIKSRMSKQQILEMLMIESPGLEICKFEKNV